jgi:hypothetical protein
LLDIITGIPYISSGPSDVADAERLDGAGQQENYGAIDAFFYT